MEHTSEEIIKEYEKQIGHCLSERETQLFRLHIQEVEKSYQRGYEAGQAAANKKP